MYKLFLYKGRDPVPIVNRTCQYLDEALTLIHKAKRDPDADRIVIELLHYAVTPAGCGWAPEWTADVAAWQMPADWNIDPTTPQTVQDRLEAWWNYKRRRLRDEKPKLPKDYKSSDPAAVCAVCTARHVCDGALDPALRRHCSLIKGVIENAPKD